MPTLYTIGPGNYIRPHRNIRLRTYPEGVGQAFRLGDPLIFDPTVDQGNAVVRAPVTPVPGTVLGFARTAATRVAGTPITLALLEELSEFVVPIHAGGRLDNDDLGKDFALIPDPVNGIWRIDTTNTTNRLVHVVDFGTRPDGGPGKCAHGDINGTYVVRVAPLVAAGDTVAAHAATHAAAGSDPVTLAESQVTNLVADLAGKASTAHQATHRAAGSDPVDVKTLAGFPGGTGTFLRSDGTFAAPPGGGGGSGDVVGPGSAVDGHFATFDGATGKLIKDQGATATVNQGLTISGALNAGDTIFAPGAQFKSAVLYNDAGDPNLLLWRPANAANKKRWLVTQQGDGDLYVQSLDDAGAAQKTFRFNRDGDLYIPRNVAVSGFIDSAGDIYAAGVIYQASKPVLAVTGGFPGGTATFLRADGTFAAPSGGGKPFLSWTANQNQPPATIYATLSVRNAHPVLEFDASIDEEAIFGGVLPLNYAGGGVTVEVWFAMASATTGSTRWQVALERIPEAGNSIDTDSFAAFVAASSGIPGTAGIVAKFTVALTAGAQMDSLVAGEAFRLKLRRDADQTTGTDDATGDAHVLRVALRET